MTATRVLVTPDEHVYVAIVSEAAKIDSEHGFCLWGTSRLHDAVLPLFVGAQPPARRCPPSSSPSPSRVGTPLGVPSPPVVALLLLLTCPSEERQRRARPACPLKSKAGPGCPFLHFATHIPGRHVVRFSFERQGRALPSLPSSPFYSKRTL